MRPESPPSSTSRWLILVIACLAQFMVVIDATVVNVALPRIQTGLHFSPGNLQWVVNAYTLIFGGFLLLGGRAADLLGRKRLFVAGIVLFSAASLLNGLAQSPGMLIVGRGIQGLGGALVSPAALSIITTTFTDRSERTRALGVWSAIAAAGAAVGLLLGGVLTDLASWRWIFIVNVPVGIATVALALRFVPESRLEPAARSASGLAETSGGRVVRLPRHRTFDLLGASAVTTGLLVLVFAIVKAQPWGWGSPKTIGLLAAGVALLGAFLAIERRSQAPLMRLGIFRVRTLSAGNGALLLVASAMFGMFFFASLYVQQILGYSPLKAGLAFLPVTVGMIVGSVAAQQLIKRFGVRNVAVTGIVFAAVGMLVLTRLPVNGSYAGNLLVGLLPMSIGMGLTFVPVTLLATSGVTGEDAGLASGLFNTSQQVGGSLGLAILSTLAASRTSGLLHGTASAHAVSAQLAARVAGYHAAFAAAAVMLALAAVIMVAVLRRRHERDLDLDLVASVAAA